MSHGSVRNGHQKALNDALKSQLFRPRATKDGRLVKRMKVMKTLEREARQEQREDY